MNPERAYQPAIKLSDGEVLSGEAHSILVLRAVEMGLQDNLTAGHLNAKGIFFPVYPTDEDLIPKIDNEISAIEFAHSCSKGQRDACERLSNGNHYFKFVVERWDSLKRLPMFCAVKRLDNGHIYLDVPAHGSTLRRHPELTFVETATDTHQLAIAGFLHEDGRFLNRLQAAQVMTSITGITLNQEKMLSGEEWIPKLESEDDAVALGRRMHERATFIAKDRINVFTSLRKNEEHVEFLKIALKENERRMVSEIYSRSKRSK